MSHSLEVVVGDNKTEISFTLKDADGIAINITGYTLKFCIRKQGAAANTNNATNTCTIVSGAAGTFKYAIAATDFPSSGYYNGQLRITSTDTKTHPVPRFIRILAIESYL